MSASDRLAVFLSKGFSPASTIFTLFAFFTGLFFVFLPGDLGVSNTILYKTAPALGSALWGAMLLLGSSACMYGLWRTKPRLLQAGAITCFIAYVYSFMIYLQAGAWLPLINVALVNMLGYAYFALAAQITRRYPLTDCEK